MLTVLLYGFLGKKYGRRHRLAIETPAEAIRAFCANFPEFKKDIIADGKQAYRVLAGAEDRADAEGLHVSTSKTIKVVPIVGGSGSFGKILMGAALVGLSFYLPGAGGALGQFASSVGGKLLVGAMSSIGWSLVMGGISSLLFSPPKSSNSGSGKNTNTAFDGPVNTSGQGRAVPVCYGEMVVGSHTISVGLTVGNVE